MTSDPALTLNLLLRGGTVGVLLLIATALWRDRRGPVAVRLGAFFACGVAAATLAATPGFAAWPEPWRVAFVAPAAGAMFVFWLFTRALFDDDFSLRAWHAGAWVALAAIGVINCLVAGPQRAPLASVLGWFMGLMPVAWSVLAIVQSAASWREDLVEGRRRMRTVVVATTAVYTVAQLLAAAISGAELRAVVESPANAAGTALLTLFVAWRMLQVRTDELFAPAVHTPALVTTSAPAVPVPAAPPSPDARQLATLNRLMDVERVYREPSLTIAALATRMGLPEHSLRKLINQALGHRNFNAFLNTYRIAEAKRALNDSALADVPVLSIAMDAGFQSIGPFNRAFKADTGVTPTAYRRGPAVRLAETKSA